MKLAVLGTGYVGLVSGVCLAAKGHDVTCVDLRAEVVAALNAGRPHIHERGLPELLREVLAAGRFRATLDLDAALDGARLVLVAVGTPSENGKIDLRFITEAARQLGEKIRVRREFLSVVIKSTVVPGTTDTVVRAALEQSSGKKLGEGFGLGMNPEFLREGEAVADFMGPDRVVLGHEDPATLAALQELYRPWGCEQPAVNTRTAELIKYANNCLLATQISAVNELANLAAALGGVDIMDVMRGVHLDKRWNPLLPDGTRAAPQILSYLVPGCGFGGSCFPKDVQALRSQGEAAGLPMALLNAVLAINDAQPAQVPALLRRQWGGSVAGKKILVHGLAFKPDTHDVRESASLKIVADLLSGGAAAIAHDPIAAPNFRRAAPGLTVSYTEDWSAELATADAVVVATRWPEYGALIEPGNLARLAGKPVVDARRMFTPTDFPASAYLAIGRTAR